MAHLLLDRVEGFVVPLVEQQLPLALHVAGPERALQQEQCSKLK